MTARHAGARIESGEEAVGFTMRRGLTVVVLAGAFLGSVLTASYLSHGEGGDSFDHAPSTSPTVFDIERDPDVPPLPFDDNPDPSQCGIPVRWGDEDNLAWLSGFWRGELIPARSVGL